MSISKVIAPPSVPPELKLTGALTTAAVWIMRKLVKRAKEMAKIPARKGVDLFLGDRG